MTQESKDLLLHDLCARLPYGVRIAYKEHKYDFTHYWLRSVDPKSDRPIMVYHSEKIGCGSRSGFNPLSVDETKPYLRPMSSMTEEEKVEYTSYCFEQPFLQKGKAPTLGSIPMCIDWLNKKMFDYRGLIEKGLAIPMEDFILIKK